MDAQLNEKQKDKAQGSRVLHTWYAAFKNVKLYKPEHPTSRETAGKLSALFNTEVFRDKLGYSISNIDGLFTSDEIFFIEESLVHYDLLHALEEHNIATVSFGRGITEEEIIEFSNYLLRKKTPGIADPGFLTEHIKAINESKETWAKGHLRSLESKYKGSESFVRAREIYDEWLTLTPQVINKLLDEQSISLSDFSDHLDRLIDEINQNPGTLSALVTTMPITQLNVQHSIHTMILSIFIAEQLSLDANTIKTLGLGAMLHDLGRWFLPHDFTTGYALQKGDTDFIRLHSRDGASYLAGVPGLPMSVVRIALEHHIGYDGEGYPVLPGQSGANFMSQIVGLADFASWATVSEDFYHKPVAPHRLVRTLMARAGTQFDPLLVKLIIPFYGLYPAGTEVRLTTGEKALVVEPNIRNITRPEISVINADGSTQQQWLMPLSQNQNGSPYQKSIRGLIRHVKTTDEHLK